RVCLRLPAYSASAKVICFMEKLGWRDRRISPDAGSLFQTFLRAHCVSFTRAIFGDLDGAEQLLADPIAGSSVGEAVRVSSRGHLGQHTCQKQKEG
ncbi:hypothetical protein, partial [Pseudomonas monteilii]|uniref:hypothetical protein n=1 Tax=Pseudomonas monteilii TaxID=76759 RepID=UPI001C612B16